MTISVFKLRIKIVKISKPSIKPKKSTLDFTIYFFLIPNKQSYKLFMNSDFAVKANRCECVSVWVCERERGRE